MGVRERCSCGAEIETDEDDSIRIVRQWRRAHKCILPDPVPEGAGSSHLENGIGFRVQGLEVPTRNFDPWDE